MATHDPAELDRIQAALQEARILEARTKHEFDRADQACRSSWQPGLYESNVYAMARRDESLLAAWTATRECDRLQDELDKEEDRVAVRDGLARFGEVVGLEASDMVDWAGQARSG